MSKSSRRPFPIIYQTRNVVVAVWGWPRSVTLGNLNDLIDPFSRLHEPLDRMASIFFCRIDCDSFGFGVHCLLRPTRNMFFSGLFLK